MNSQKGKARKHHKYIRRFMKNGKWRYIYKEIKNASKRVNGSLKSIVSASASSSSFYNNAAAFFDRLGNKDKYNKRIIKKYQRRIEAQDHLYEGKLNVKEKVPKGKGTEPKDHKYIAKIPLGNGKFRYFYSQKELQAYYKRHPEQKLDFPLKKGNMTDDQDGDMVNPNYGKKGKLGVSYDPGYMNNCYDCTLVYDARRKGYDVTAISDKDGIPTEMMNNFWVNGVKNTRTTDGRTKVPPIAISVKANSNAEVKQLNSDLTEMPNNSHGNLTVQWQKGGGHSITWEKKNGKVYIRDNQINKEVPIKKYFQTYGDILPGKSSYLRTDNLQLSPQAKEYLQPAKRNSKPTKNRGGVESYAEHYKSQDQKTTYQNTNTDWAQNNAYAQYQHASEQAYREEQKRKAEERERKKRQKEAKERWDKFFGRS